jgi:diadenosine tetraphosphate (Ap4A) HIT family hydrolase
MTGSSTIAQAPAETTNRKDARVDVTSFTAADLARLSLSARLRDLSEAFRVAVAADGAADGAATADSGNGAAPNAAPGLAGHLWSLLATEIPALQEAIVDHVRSSGGSWADVAALAGLSEDEARERWKGIETPRIADPVAAAASLDEWYIRHAQLEPLARVRDPFSRLLSARSRPPAECLICVKYRGGVYPMYGGYTTPPGGYVVDDGMWRVAHGPTAYWPAGTLLVESYRHFLDYAEMTDAEATAIGPLIHRLVGPLREATGAPRIHVFSNMEGVAHFHVWLVPRVGDVASGRTFIGNPGYCSVPAAEAAIGRLKAAMARVEADR